MKKDKYLTIPLLKELLKNNGIEIGTLAERSGMTPTNFRSKLSDADQQRYFSAEEYNSIILALKSLSDNIKAFIKSPDRPTKYTNRPSSKK
jgi:hypothetical protein